MGKDRGPPAQSSTPVLAGLRRSIDLVQGAVQPMHVTDRSIAGSSKGQCDGQTIDQCACRSDARLMGMASSMMETENDG